MRTTIRLNDALLRRAKRAALEQNKTFTSLVEDALTVWLQRESKTSHGKRLRLPAGGEGGLMPGVDLDSNASLLDRMDELS